MPFSVMLLLYTYALLVSDNSCGFFCEAPAVDGPVFFELLHILNILRQSNFRAAIDLLYKKGDYVRSACPYITKSRG